MYTILTVEKPQYSVSLTGQQKVHDQDREKMTKTLTRELALPEGKRNFLMVWTYSDNTQYEGCKLDSLARDGEGNIFNIGCTQMELGMRNFKFDDIRELHISEFK